MPASRTKFYLDKQNKKIAGVCAGIADYTGVERKWVRIALILLTIFSSGWFIIAYLVAAAVAPSRPHGLYSSGEDARFWQGVRSNPKRSTAEIRSTFREIDRRLADIETLYTSRNSRLASEIENLR